MTKERYIQIDKGHCGGDRALFDEIKKVLYDSKKFRVTEDPIVFTIIKIIQEEEEKLEKVEVKAEKQLDKGLENSTYERTSHIKVEEGKDNSAEKTLEEAKKEVDTNGNDNGRNDKVDTEKTKLE